MNIEEAVAIVQDMFDVTEKRLPASVATFHVNQACGELSDEHDVLFDRGVFDFTLLSDSEAYIDVDTIVDGNLSFSYARSVWLNPDTDEGSKLEEYTYEEISGAYNGTPSTPLWYARHGSRIYFRPMADVDVPVRISFAGRPITISSGQTNAWLTNAPNAVINKAAYFGAVYLLEDQRATVFAAIAADAARKAEMASSMTGFDAQNEAEEP